MSQKTKREYVSGTGWCVWRWTFTPSGYITRLHLVKTPWFALMVHWINGPDREACCHDHPVTFLSIILRGGYRELRNGKYISRSWFNFIRASRKDIHKIVAVIVDPPTVTFCLVGPKTRDWGFHTPDGWIPWQDYNDRKYK